MSHELAAQVLEALRKASATIVTAESCTGGMLCAALTDVPGSSDVVEGGFVTYSYALKTQALGVSPDRLHRYGAVSQEVALDMVAGALDRSPARLAIAITGVAGPGASEAKPEGLVWFAIAQRGATAVAEQCNFGALGRDNVRHSSVTHALNMIRSALA